MLWNITFTAQILFTSTKNFCANDSVSVYKMQLPSAAEMLCLFALKQKVWSFMT